MIVNLDTALAILQRGETCAVPTETVYGLAARYDDEHAIQKVFSIKQRPLDHPLIVHIAHRKWLGELCTDIPAYVNALIEHFWPGPLTLILNKTARVSHLVTANQSTVAIRMPDHPDFLQLIRKLNCPVVAPSANRFCQTSPTQPSHVESGLGTNIPVLDGGPCSVGIESTILLATNQNTTEILRPGIISTADIESISKVPCITQSKSNIKTPGKHKVHYQPKKPLFVTNTMQELSNVLARHPDTRYYVMSFFDFNDTISPPYTVMPDSPEQYAQVLYSHWQSSTILEVDAILMELPPDRPEWQGIRDRIFKASHGFIE